MKEILLKTLRWGVGGLVLGLAGYFLWKYVLGPIMPGVDGVDDRLPLLFHSSAVVFWGWVIVLGLCAIGLGIWAFRLWRALHSPLAEPKEREDAAESTSSLAAAWKEMLARFQPPGGTPFYLAIAPEMQNVADLLAASGLRAHATAPAESDAPLFGFSTDEGVILWCGGKTATTLPFICRALQAYEPAKPPLRGVIVLLPASQVDKTQDAANVAAARGRLRQALQKLTMRCPVFVMVTGMEGVPGFLEFARRMPPELRSRGRCGFSLPEGVAPTYERFSEEFGRFIRWYDVSMLDLIALDPLSQSSNEGLYSLSRWLHGNRRRLLGLLEALADPSEAEPVDLSGCYFAATGQDREDCAFAAGVVRGRVTGDPNSARWSLETSELDDAHRRVAYMVGGIGAFFALSAWLCILLGIKSLEPVKWVLFGLTILGWCVVSYRIMKRGRVDRA